jgi:hypothetical protein
MIDGENIHQAEQPSPSSPGSLSPSETVGPHKLGARTKPALMISWGRQHETLAQRRGVEDCGKESHVLEESLVVEETRKSRNWGW